jgi:Asp-tRNA(Asn)/Glu-tRNA(Gln) amidotransferase A subunit family amidase
MSDPFLDATAQADLIARGECSPSELVDEAIARIERLNRELNAVVIPLFEKARGEAERAPHGPFRGVPYLLKDLTLVTRGDPTSQGIRGVHEAGLVGSFDSYYVERMRRAGFVLVGKTNLPELGMATTTEPRLWGAARNPWDPRRSTGGSSGGSAAAVASGMVPIAHANDGGGSTRMPASHCGVVGMKGTRGRVSAGPPVRYSDEVAGLAGELCTARTVRDVAAVLDVVSGHRPGDAYCAPPPTRPFRDEVGVDPGRLRIGVLAQDPSGSVTTHPDCANAAKSTAKVLSDRGHDVSEAYPPAMRKGGWPQEYMRAVSVVVKRELDRLGTMIGRPLTEEDMEPATWAFAAQAASVSAAQYAEGVDALRVRAGELECWWEDDGWDVLVTPTMPAPPPLLGAAERFGDPEVSGAEVFTLPFNVSGQPAVSLPLHWSSDGLPIGVQIVAAFGREDLLFRLAGQLEQEMPWGDRRPPITASAT